MSQTTKEVKSLTLTTYGTRGSQAISNRESVEVGGNTTCLKVESPCIPPWMSLGIDGGSGLPVMARDMAARGIIGSREEGDGHEKDVAYVLLSHVHWDHIMGFTTAAELSFNPFLPVHLIGPVSSQKKGPKEMMQTLFQDPYFPEEYRKIASHFEFHPLDFPSTYVFLVHPKGGLKQFALDEYERLIKKRPDKMPFPDRQYLPLSECLVIRMLKTSHPQMTISFRFDEMPTGKSAVFMTDNESMDGIPTAYKRHVRDVDLLLLDVQYDKETYYNITSGFGHGWAGFATRLANAAGVKRLGTIHHNPWSTDTIVYAIVEEIRDLAAEDISRSTSPAGLILPENIFACVDYGVYVV